MQDYNVNQNSNAANKKKVSVVMTLVLVLMLFLTGTFAWKDYRQHKTNVMSGKGSLNRDVKLVENFDPNGDAKDWKEGTIDKEVWVKNDLEGKVYVRLTLGEFMSLGSQDYVYSDLRYLINEDGDYIRSNKITLEDVIADLQAQLLHTNYDLKLDKSMISTDEDLGNRTLEHDDDLRIYQVTEYDGYPYYYIATRKDDANGQYGKHIPLKADDDSTYDEIIVGGGEDKKRPNLVGVGEQHHQHEKNEDCARYDDIYFDQAGPQTAARDYISLVNSNKNVVSLSEYTQNQDNYKSGVWVYVDSTSGVKQQPYVYWSNALTTVTYGDEIDRSKTTNILDKLSLDLKPTDGFDYYMHIEMEAVSFDELKLWDKELPNILRDNYKYEESMINPERPNVWPSVPVNR